MKQEGYQVQETAQGRAIAKSSESDKARSNASFDVSIEHRQNASPDTSFEFMLERVEPEDIGLLIDWRMEVLHAVFAEFENKTNTQVDWDALREANLAYYMRALTDGTHIACFALPKQLGPNTPIGCGSICLHEELPSPDNPSGKCAYLMNMYTRPEYRGNGVAGAIVEWVVDQARAAGAQKIYLETTPDGRGVYERAGFADFPDLMKLPLDQAAQ